MEDDLSMSQIGLKKHYEARQEERSPVERRVSKPHYWHRMKPENKKKVLKSGILMRLFLQMYKQPDWCKYPEALSGMMGCGSLMNADKKINKEFCKNCDCAAHYKEKAC